jgi:hypothetical protein
MVHLNLLFASLIVWLCICECVRLSSCQYVARHAMQAGDAEYDQVVAEDEVEEHALDRLGTISSMDAVMGPDSVVFRDRNFIGYPREPDSMPTGDGLGEQK